MTTTTLPSAASDAPWYHGVAPLPVTNAPPWIHTSTGRLSVVTPRREHVEVVTLLGGRKAAAAEQPFHAAEHLRTQGAVRRGVELSVELWAERGDATGFSNRSDAAYGMPLKIAMSTGAGP